MKQKHALAHMQAAYVYANLSYCKRRQVGCVIVKDDTIIAIGYNGTNPGEENICEDENGNSKSNTVHAEDNALRKLIRSPNNAIDSTVFVTTCPCINCARRLSSAGVKAIYYNEIYRNTEGLEYLKERGIKIQQIHLEKIIKNRRKNDNKV